MTSAPLGPFHHSFMPRYTPEQLIDAFYGPPPKPNEKKLEDLRQRVKKPERPKAELDLTLARELLGKDVFGPEEVERVFEINLDPDKVPPIPYSREQLEKARELGEMLVLRVDKTDSGEPLTAQKLNDLLQPKFTAAGKGKILANVDWYQNEPFFIADTPRLEWKLVSKNIFSNPDGTPAVNLNYLHQTKLLRDRLKPIGALSPGEEAECPDALLESLSAKMGVDWTSQQIVDQKKYSANWEPVAKKLANLQINQNHRRKIVEAMYDTLLAFETNDERLLPNIYEWTNTRSAGGDLVGFGCFDSDGDHVSDWRPDDRTADLGLVSSR